MKERDIRNLLEKKMSEIGRTSCHIGDGFDEEVIHKFRVTVKALRAFLRLYWLYSTSDKPGISSEFLKLYHLAGAIREAQLELKQGPLSAYFPAGYRSRVEVELAGFKHSWSEHYDKQVVKTQDDLLQQYPYFDLPVFALSDFVDQRLDLIRLLINMGAITDTELHTVRKHLKDIIYNMKLAQKKWEPAYKLCAGKPLAMFGVLATEIGDYNDGRLMQEHLESYVSGTNKGILAKDDIGAQLDSVLKLSSVREAILSRLAGVLAEF
jgi:CHAD domain-containing protein